MMKYRPNSHQQKKPPRWSLVILVVVLMILIVFAGQFWLRPLSGVAFSLAKPLWFLRDRLIETTLNLQTGIKNKQKLFRENQNLKQEITELKATLVNYQQVVRERELLRQELNLKQEKPELRLAKLSLSPWEQAPNVLLATLPPGTTAQVGEWVSFRQTILLGVISEVRENLIKIKLFSAPGVQTAVTVGVDNTPAVARGVGSGNFTLSLPRGLILKIGDTVRAVNSSQDLILGLVGAVENDAGDSWQTALIRLPINLYYVHYVEIGNN